MDIKDIKIDGNTIYLVLNPILDDAGEWGGAVDIKMATHDGGSLTEDETLELRNSAYTMVAALHADSYDDDIHAYLQEAVVEMFYNDEDGSLTAKDTRTTTSSDGKVVTLTFNSVTEGSA